MTLQKTPISTRTFSAPATGTWTYVEATNNWLLTVCQYRAYVYPSPSTDAWSVLIEDRLTDEDVFITLAWSLDNAFGTAETFIREELAGSSNRQKVINAR